jgi:hypothetical protein
MRQFFTLMLLAISPVLLAEPSAIELKHPNGDMLTIQRLASGEVWGSLFLSDRMTESFASNELIVLQVDTHKPVKLTQGLRSCGAPAPKAQQVVYQFEQQSSDWTFSGNAKPKTDVLKLLGWDAGEFDTLDADRRPEVVDFPIDAGEKLALELSQAETISFRYVTNQGKQRESLFQLAPHQTILKQLIP